MDLRRFATVVGLVACTVFGQMPHASATPASAPASCGAYDDVGEKIGDMQFDLGNLRIVMNNLYPLVDVKRHDEEFRLKTMDNAIGRLRDAVGEVHNPGLSQLYQSVKSDYQEMRDTVMGQFVVVQDEHYDLNSNIPYQSPRATGNGDDPAAFAAIDAVDGDLQSLGDASDGLRYQSGCPPPSDDDTGSDETGPDGAGPQCRFHPGSFHCDATGSILH